MCRLSLALLKWLLPSEFTLLHQFTGKLQNASGAVWMSAGWPVLILTRCCRDPDFFSSFSLARVQHLPSVFASILINGGSFSTVVIVMTLVTLCSQNKIISKPPILLQIVELRSNEFNLIIDFYHLHSRWMEERRQFRFHAFCFRKQIENIIYCSHSKTTVHVLNY